MAGRCIHGLCHASGGTVALAIVGSAEVGSALHDFARDLYLGLAGIVAGFAIAMGNGAAATSLAGGMVRGVPVGGPLPDVADHVVEAVAVGRELAY